MAIVPIDNTFTVTIPKNMEYSNKLDRYMFSAIRIGPHAREAMRTNEFAKEFLGIEMEVSLSSPFSADRCFIIHNDYYEFKGNTNNNLLEKEVFDDIKTLIKSTEALEKKAGLKYKERKHKWLVKTEELLIHYSYLIDEVGFDGRVIRRSEIAQFSIDIITSNKVYSGQIWLNDLNSFNERIKEVERWLRTVKLISKGSGKKKNNSTSKKTNSRPKKKIERNVNGIETEQAKTSRKKVKVDISLDDGEKINGFEALKTWIGKDFFFFDKSDYKFDRTHYHLEGIQLNAARVDDLPKGADIDRTSVLLKLFLEELEQNPKFMCEKDKIGDNVKKVLGKKNFTGFSLILLMQEHLINIVFADLNSDEKTNNNIIVSIDPKIRNDIPRIEKKIEDLIKFSLEYNENNKEFNIAFYDAAEFEFGEKKLADYEDVISEYIINN